MPIVQKNDLHLVYQKLIFFEGVIHFNQCLELEKDIERLTKNPFMPTDKNTELDRTKEKFSFPKNRCISSSQLRDRKLEEQLKKTFTDFFYDMEKRNFELIRNA